MLYYDTSIHRREHDMGEVKKLLHPITAIIPCGVFSRVNAISALSGDNHQMLIKLGEDALLTALIAWRTSNGKVQDHFPTLNADEREFLMTGITDSEWDSLAAEDAAADLQRRIGS